MNHFAISLDLLAKYSMNRMGHVETEMVWHLNACCIIACCINVSQYAQSTRVASLGHLATCSPARPSATRNPPAFGTTIRLQAQPACGLASSCRFLHWCCCTACWLLLHTLHSLKECKGVNLLCWVFMKAVQTAVYKIIDWTEDHESGSDRCVQHH